MTMSRSIQELPKAAGITARHLERLRAHMGNNPIYVKGDTLEQVVYKQAQEDLYNHIESKIVQATIQDD